MASSASQHQTPGTGVESIPFISHPGMTIEPGMKSEDQDFKFDQSPGQIFSKEHCMRWFYTADELYEVLSSKHLEDQSPGQVSLKDQKFRREEIQDFEFELCQTFQELYRLQLINANKPRSTLEIEVDDLEELRMAFSLFSEELRRGQCQLGMSNIREFRTRSNPAGYLRMGAQAEAAALLFSRAFTNHMLMGLCGTHDAGFNDQITDIRDSFSGENSQESNTQAISSEAIIQVANNAVPAGSTTEASTPSSSSLYNATSDPEDGRDSSSPPGSAEEKSHTHNSSLIKTFLAIATGAVYTLLTIRYSGNTSLSPNAKMLSHFAGACNLVGFLCCLFGTLLPSPKPGAVPRARIVTGIGYICIAYGFIAVMALQMWDSDLMLWISAVACVVLFPAFVFAIFIRDGLCKCAYWRCW